LRQFARSRKPFGGAPAEILLALGFALAPAAAWAGAPCDGATSPLAVQQFIDRPYSLLQDPLLRDPEELTAKIRKYALEGAPAVAAIIKLAASAREDQRKSIAKGLARAATECRAINPTTSRLIAEQVGRAIDPGLRRVFFDETPDRDPAPPPPGADSDRSRSTLPISSRPDAGPPKLSNPFEPLNPLKLR
jgi:hypothetical protein